ncbi:MAG: hypothetical protein HGA66_17720 [Holophaga sp.]|nr:hypothetical protein [Holophaga sp.]
MNLVASAEIPEIIAQLQVSAKEGNASILTIAQDGSPDAEGIRLQFSIDHGVVGLDWVLLGHRNVADQSRIAEMAAALGYQVEERDLEQVRYLRMTGQGIAELGTAIIRDFYGINPATRIPMLTVGFKWDPEAHWN